jgi:hypothetical protein
MLSVLFGCLNGLALVGAARATVLIDQDFQAHAAGTTIDTIGWVLVAETGGPPIVREESPGGNKYIVTSTLNNQPVRYQLPFTNPGFFSGTTLTFTADLWDPLVTENPGQLSTFPRAYMGIYELAKPSSMPPYFGIETNDGDINDDIMTGEWVVSGENFGNPPNPTPRMFSAEGSVGQDTWYTVKSEWNLGTKKMNLLVNPRGSADPFTQIFTDVTLGFDDPNQNMAALDAFQIRMLRGTRMDNFKVEYDAVMPPGLAGDYNNDTRVDAADYVMWRQNEGQMVTMPNDTTGVPTVGDAQYMLWKANFGNPPASGTGLGQAAAPEPTALLLAALLGLSVTFLRRRSVAR